MPLATRLVLILMLPSGVAAAVREANQPTSPIVAEFAGCGRIADLAPRESCYAAAAQHLAGGVARGDIVVLDRSGIREARHSLFGFRLPTLSFLQGGAGPRDPADDVVESSVAAATGFGFGLWTITLANGAVWRTTEPERIAAPRTGDAVRIRRTALGGYLMTAGDQHAARVVRVG